MAVRKSIGRCMQTLKRKGRTGTAMMGLAMILGITVFVTAPAYAAYDDVNCTVYLWSPVCSTSAIDSHTSQHWVIVYFENTFECPISIKVTDVTNGAVVYQDYQEPTSSDSYYKTIYGLYARYKLTISEWQGCIVRGHLTNYN